METEIFGQFVRDEVKGREAFSHYKVLEPDDIADAVLYMVGTAPHVAVHDILIRPKSQPH